MDFDKVAVLDGGNLVEFDSPHTLLDVPDSAFAKLYNAVMAEEEEEEEDAEDPFKGKESCGGTSESSF